MVLVLSISQCLYSQKRVNFNFIQNINIWKPYSLANENSDVKFDRRSSTRTWSMMYTAVNKPDFALKVGLAVKDINYVVYNRITTYIETIYDYWPPQDSIGTSIYNKPTDFRSKSLNLGVNLSMEKKITAQRPMFIGVTAEIYPFEFYKVYYEQRYVALSIVSSDSKLLELTKRFANANISAFYSYNVMNNRYASIALKLSAGANLYSDWNQFSRYAWLGLGFEVGFGQFKKDKL
jgi:hypothetical protein